MSNFELLGVGKSGAGPVAGTDVAWDYDVSDISTLKQNQAGSTDVTASGQECRLLVDKSAAGWDLEAISDAATGVAYTDSGGLQYLNVTGTGLLKREEGYGSLINDCTILMAVRALAGTDDRLIGMRQGASGIPIYSPMQSRNSTPSNQNASMFIRNDAGTPIGSNATDVSVGVFDGSLVVYGIIHSGDTITPIVDGVKGTPVALGTPQGVFTLDRFSFFGLYQNSGSAHFNCEFYGSKAFAGVATDAEIAAETTRLGALQGRTI